MLQLGLFGRSFRIGWRGFRLAMVQPIIFQRFMAFLHGGRGLGGTSLHGFTPTLIGGKHNRVNRLRQRGRLKSVGRLTLRIPASPILSTTAFASEYFARSSA